MATSKGITIPEEMRQHSMFRRALVELFLFGRQRTKNKIIRWVSEQETDCGTLRLRNASDVRFRYGVHVITTKDETVEEGNRKLRQGDFEIEPYWFHYSLLRLKLLFGITLTPMEDEYMKLWD
jgi:hypothetical protein